VAALALLDAEIDDVPEQPADWGAQTMHDA
jgi:hypothetical protein